MIPLMSLFFKSHDIVLQYRFNDLLHGINFSKMFNICMFLMAAIFSIFCIWISHAADVTLHRHLATRKTTRQVLVEGVWRYTRHGNYFGEIGFWWSLWLFGVSFQRVCKKDDEWKEEFNFASLVWCPLVETILFYVVSIPWVERKMSLRKPKYSLYQEQVNMLIPWFPSRKFSERLYMDK